MRKLILPTVICLCLGVTAARAQIYAGAFADNIAQEYRALNVVADALKVIPREASKAEDFVPPHWKIEQREQADFNGDGQMDDVLLLSADYQDRDYMRKIGSEDEKGERVFMLPHIIAVLLADKNGKPYLETINYRLEDNIEDPHTFSLEVEKNIIIVNAVYGSTREPLRHYVLRFRWQKLQFQLIGFDVDNGKDPEDRTGDYKTSFNYLTGEQIETSYVADKTGKGKFIPVTKKFSFAPFVVEFADARLNDNLRLPY